MEYFRILNLTKNKNIDTEEGFIKKLSKKIIPKSIYVILNN